MLLAIIEIINRGGIILPILFFISVAAWYILLSRFYRLGTMEKKIQATIDSQKLLSESNAKAKVMQKHSPFYVSLASSLKSHVLSKDINIAATIYSIAPLLGLLGTVTGMIKTFTTIQLFGNQNPALMAEGISQALITTQAGLITAFPIMLFYTFLVRKIARLRNDLPLDAFLDKG